MHAPDTPHGRVPEDPAGADRAVAGTGDPALSHDHAVSRDAASHDAASRDQAVVGDHAVPVGGHATTHPNGVVARDGMGEGGGAPGWRSDDVPGWAGNVMAVLRFLTRLVEVNLLVVAGTLAGGVVLGLGPALVAGSAVLHDPDLAMTPWRGFWRQWRTGWRRSNLLFAPFWPVSALLWADAAAVGQASGPVHAALLAGLTLASVWTAVALAWWPRIVLRYDDAAPAVWRYLLLTPLLAPGVALAVLITLAATAAAIVGVPLVALVAGVSFPLWATGRLVDGRGEATRAS